MRAGQNRHYVTIKRLSTTSTGDGMGSVTRGYTSYKRCWANIKPLSAREYITGNALENEITHSVQIRYYDCTGLTAKDRIYFGSRYFNIKSLIKPFERNIYWEIIANED